MTEPTAALYDVDGTHLADLPLAAGIQWQYELSAPGALSLRLPLDDDTTASATSRRILKVSWRGQVRQAARIDSSSTDVAVDGRMWRQWDNLPGLMSILAAVPVYPEYGLDRASNSSRIFGYPSRYGHGAWLDSGDFTPAIGVDWSAMTGARSPVNLSSWGFDAPNPQWIAKNGPNADEPAGTFHYFRRLFNTDTRKLVRILATGDNSLDLWLDGEHIVDSTGQGQFTWKNLFEVSLVLLPSVTGGRHTFAARVRNGHDVGAGANHMGFILTMQEVDAAGALVDAGSPIINSDSDWDVSDIAPGFRRSEVVIRLWGEGGLYGYAATSLLSLGFTGDLDSAGVAWADTPGEYTFDVGSSLLDVLAAFTEKGVDVNVDPGSLELRMWNRRGADLTDTVILALGRDGGNLMTHTVARVEPTFNTILMQLADGRWVQRQDTGAVTANGREATGLALGSTSDAGSAFHVADAQLADAARPTLTFTTTVSTLDGPQVYVDYGPGDTITVPNENGTGGYAARVMAITGDASADGPVQVTLDLMLDKSATAATYEVGSAGTGDPGDLEAPAPTPPGSGGGGGDTGSGGTPGAGSFEDTFATLDSSRWNVRTDYQSNHHGFNLPANVTVQSDGLHITCKRETHTSGTVTRPYTTGYIDSIGNFSALVGRWEFDVILPTFKGAWPALWLRCDSTAGEIDVLEAVGGLPTMVVQTVHQDTNGGADKSGYEWHGTGFDPSVVHTYALERDSDGSLRWYIDGTLTRSRTPTDLDNEGNPMTWLAGSTFASPLNIRINLQVGGAMPAYYGKDVDGTSVLPGDMVISAVRFIA